jgi:DNA ligase-1
LQARLADVALLSRQLAETRSRNRKAEFIAALLRTLAPPDAERAVAFLIGTPLQGRLGVGWATLQAARTEPAAAPTLGLAEVDESLSRIAGAAGAGSAAERLRLLHALLARATHDEQHFLRGLLLGEVRQGAQEGVVLEGIARAAGIPSDGVRRAYMLAGDLPKVARAVSQGGAAALAAFRLTLFRPVQPMLAQSADAVADAIDALGTAGLEYKLDGARIQVHRAGGDVRVFTRQLNDVTASVPDIVKLAQAFPATEFVLDGEAIALRADGAPHAFQTTMRRFSRTLDIAQAQDELPLHAFFFDLLHLDGQTLIDRTLADRVAALADATAGASLVPRIVTASEDEARAFLRQSRAAGHEGVVAKALDARYEAGRRGRGWVKVKPANTLDLVVLAAEWGHGRRTGVLSNLHLGARDPAGGFVMVGKTFKGLTDALLAWQTRELLAREVSRDAFTVHVRPELVVEIALNEVQASARYPGGVALRFARVKRYRPDKQPVEADTIYAVRALASPARAGPRRRVKP